MENENPAYKHEKDVLLAGRATSMENAEDKTVVVTEAYGRVYESDSDICRHWNAGKDFRVLGRNSYLNDNDARRQKLRVLFCSRPNDLPLCDWRSGVIEAAKKRRDDMENQNPAYEPVNRLMYDRLAKRTETFLHQKRAETKVLGAINLAMRNFEDMFSFEKRSTDHREQELDEVVNIYIFSLNLKKFFEDEDEHLKAYVGKNDADVFVYELNRVGFVAFLDQEYEKNHLLHVTIGHSEKLSTDKKLPWYPDRREWKEYNGEGMPVDANTPVVILTKYERNDREYLDIAPEPAINFTWTWGPNFPKEQQIVAYCDKP